MRDRWRRATRTSGIGAILDECKIAKTARMTEKAAIFRIVHGPRVLRLRHPGRRIQPNIVFGAFASTQHQWHGLPVTRMFQTSPLITMSGATLNIKGVKVVTPAGIGVGGGEFTKEQKALQTASDAAQQADQKLSRLCNMLPSYSNDQEGFYRVRNQMFDLIAGTTYVASAVAAQTGQAQPAQLSSVPTAATAAAAGAGIDPAKGVANPPAPVFSGDLGRCRHGRRWRS